MTAARTWRDHAACRDEDPDLFFPVGETGAAQLQIDEAQAVCRRCPVIEWCFQWAVETGQDDGIWGGAAPRDRANYRRRTNRRKNGGQP